MDVVNEEDEEDISIFSPKNWQNVTIITKMGENTDVSWWFFGKFYYSKILHKNRIPNQKLICFQHFQENISQKIENNGFGRKHVSTSFTTLRIFLLKMSFFPINTDKTNKNSCFYIKQIYILKLQNILIFLT